MSTVQCQTCGSEITVKPSRVTRTRFCSRKCKYASPPDPLAWQSRYSVSENGCWEWTGEVGAHGYGLFRRRVAHRIVYESVVGQVPSGLVLDHLCRNKSCVNPEHLEPVTQRENLRRGNGPNAPGRTHCHAGHPMIDENLYVNPRTGIRQCRECRRRYAREHYRRTRL